MDRPISEWPHHIVDSFLSSWWDIHPGIYNQYYHEWAGVGRDMIITLREDHPSLFGQIWDDLAVKELEEYYPPRPRF